MNWKLELKKIDAQLHGTENLEVTEFFEDLLFLVGEGLLALNVEHTPEDIRQKFLNIKKFVQDKQEITNYNDLAQRLNED